MSDTWRPNIPGGDIGHLTVSRMLQQMADEICDKYCKYPDMYASKSKGDDEDMLEDLLYTEICAACPLMKI